MIHPEIKEYINQRYDRFMDYSLYHCTHQNMADEAMDVLNTVFEDILKKDEDYLFDLFSKKKNGYTELDYLILSTIKTYASSPTAPYRWKYSNRLPIDANADYRRIEIIDEPDSEQDRAGQTVFEMDLVRWIFERLELNGLEYCIFQWRFYEDQSVADWPVLNERKNLYAAYNIVSISMYEILKSQGLTKAKPKTKQYNTKRVEVIVNTFNEKYLQAFRAEIKRLRYILEQEH